MKMEPFEIEACAQTVIKLMAPRFNALETAINKLSETMTRTAFQKIEITKPVLDPPAVVSSKDLKSVTGLAPTTIWRLEKIGKFPKRVRLSTGRVGWKRADIDVWLAERQLVENK